MTTKETTDKPETKQAEFTPRRLKLSCVEERFGAQANVHVTFVVVAVEREGK